MKNWEYKELKDTIREVYHDLLDQGDTPEQSLARVFEDFYFLPEESNKVENLITTIETAKIGIEELGYLFEGEVIFLKNHLLQISDELLSKELEIDEIKNLKSDLEKVLKEMGVIKIKKKSSAEDLKKESIGVQWEEIQNTLDALQTASGQTYGKNKLRGLLNELKENKTLIIQKKGAEITIKNKKDLQNLINTYDPNIKISHFV